MTIYLAAALTTLLLSWHSTIRFVQTFNAAFTMLDVRDANQLRHSEWPPTRREHTINPWTGRHEALIYPRLDYAGRPNDTFQSRIFTSP